MNQNTDTKRNIELYGDMFGLFIPFIVVFSGIIYLALTSVALPMAFWVPTAAGLAVAIALAKDRTACAGAMIRSMASEMTATMLMAWFMAGILAQILKQAGLVEGLIWAATSVGLDGHWFPVITFIIGCLVSTATGTSIGSIIALGPILYPVGATLGRSPEAMVAAIVCGAYFGDNIAPVSDTTIASAYTQGTTVNKVVRTRLKYAFAAAAIAAVLFFLFGGGGEVGDASKYLGNLSPNGLWLMIVPALLIYLMFTGTHLIVAMMSSVVVGLAICLVGGFLTFHDIFWLDSNEFKTGGVIIDGINGLVDIAVFAFLLMGLVGLLEEGGFLNWAAKKTESYAKGPTSAEVTVSGVNIAMNILSVASTIVIIMVGPFARKVLHKHKIAPERRANVIDATAAAMMCILPWSVAPLLAYLFASGSDFGVDFVIVDTIPYMFHAWALLAVMVVAIMTGWGRNMMTEEEYNAESEALIV